MTMNPDDGGSTHHFNASARKKSDRNYKKTLETIGWLHILVACKTGLKIAPCTFVS
jgi:hypothetical protein